MSYTDGASKFRLLVYAGIAVLAVAYSWFATGAEPFHVLSYVLVALPVIIVVGLYVTEGTFNDERSGVSHYYRSRSLGVSPSRSAPWLLVLLGAIVLEVVGLLLGGRSPHVPTLSTMVDHLLRTHGLRCVLFVLWLAVGVTPLRRLQRRRHDGATS
jgi:hypothetical protein